MVDSLQVAAAVIVVFVLALAVEILFACSRLYAWVRRALADPSVVPPGRYRRGSVSHSWSEAGVVENSVCPVSPTAVAPPTAAPTPEVPTVSTIEQLAAEERRKARDARGRSQDPAIGVTTTSANHHPHDGGGEKGGRARHPSAPGGVEGDGQATRRERRRSSSVRPNRLLLFSNDFSRPVPSPDWQTGQFACARCDLPLAGHRYVVHGDRPYCKACFEADFANICEKCKDRITCDVRDLSYDGRHWHERCFACSSCGAPLAQSPFAYRNERLHCAACYEKDFAPRCSACRKIFRAGTKKYEHRGRQWHAECFRCAVCEKEIGTNSFIPRGGEEMVCVPCYEKQFGQQCSKCADPITNSGVMYAGRPYHRDCFHCAHCLTPIGRDNKFTTVQNGPYCVLCYGLLFAKKCDACEGPITGVEDSKFLAFEGRNWHAGCFRCARCGEGLVGRGFLTEGEEVVCPDCCRED